MNFELRMTLVETCVVAVWGLCWCNLFFLYHGQNTDSPLAQTSPRLGWQVTKRTLSQPICAMPLPIPRSAYKTVLRLPRHILALQAFVHAGIDVLLFWKDLMW